MVHDEIPAITEAAAGDSQVQNLSGLQREAKASLGSLRDHVFLYPLKEVCGCSLTVVD